MARQERQFAVYERIASCVGTQFRTQDPYSQGNSATHNFPSVLTTRQWPIGLNNGLPLAEWYQTPGTTASRFWAGIP